MKTPRQILEERRKKQLEYYHRTKDTPEYKAKRKAADHARYLRKKAEQEKAQAKA